MKRSRFLSVTILLVLLLGLVAGTGAAQGPAGRVGPAPAGPAPAGVSRAPAPPAPDYASWHLGPYPDFDYVRHDAAFVPGPAGTSWANRIYFLGGRTSPSTELPDIWVFDPVTGVYTDTGANMIEDVSNYNSNVVLDDCTGRGPAVYVVGGTNKDGGGVNIKTVQRYYPALNLIESLPVEDNWPGTLQGYTVATMGTAVVDDIIYVYGGWQTNSANPPYFATETWALDACAPAGSRWTNLNAPLALGRCYLISAVQDGKIYAIGGIYDYPNFEDLVPTDQVEMLDTSNLAAGWQLRASLPIAIAEGRGYGIDSDTLGPAPEPGYIYIAGGGDWPLPSAEAMVYDIAANAWDQSFPDLIEPVGSGVANNAGTYVPLYTPDPDDGLPGLWTFGGRVNESCYPPPFGQTEYYPLPVQQTCSVLLVDDDWDQYDGEPYNGTGTYYYTSTLDALGYGYSRWDTWTQGDPQLADLQGYDAVVWFTGYAYDGSITPTNEADLAAYLESGGGLFVSSEDYLYERGLTSFGSQYLGIGSYVSDMNEVSLLGNAGDPIGDGLGPYTLTKPTSWPVTEPILYTDQITPSAGSGAPFHYQVSGAQSGTDVDAISWQTVFLAWPLEGLADLNDRMDVLGWSLNWFCNAAHEAELILEPPEQAGSGAPGTPVTYTLSVVNHMGYSDTIELLYVSDWPVSGPDTVGPLPNMGTQQFEVVVHIPADVGCGGEVDTAFITARSAISPTALFDTAMLETSADFGAARLEGVVYDANTDLGLPGAHLFVASGAFYTETWTAGDGFYALDLPACTFDGQAAALHYAPAVFTVSLVPAVTTTLDLYLAAGWPDLAPQTVAVTLTAGETGSFTLTLANTGTADLYAVVTEVPGDAPWLAVEPLTPTVLPGASAALHGLLDTAGLPADACYTATLAFSYDDPYVGAELVPVTLCVLSGCDAVTGVEFDWTPLTATVGAAVTLTAALEGTPTPPVEYSWAFGDGGAAVTTGTVVTHVYTATGVYTVTLTAANACGQAGATHLLTVEDITPPTQWRIFLPLVTRHS